MFRSWTYGSSLLATLILLTGCGGGGGAAVSVAAPVTIPTAPPSSSSSSGQDPDSWTMYRYAPSGDNDNEIQTAITKTTLASVQQVWSWTNPKALPYRGFFAQPLVSGGIVYVADMSGYITALRESDGTELWQYYNGLDTFISTPALYNGRLYETSYNNHIYILDPMTGTLLAEYNGIDPEGSFESSPIPLNGYLYVGSSNYNEDDPTHGCISSHQILALDYLIPQIDASTSLGTTNEPGAGVWASAIADGKGHIITASGNSCTNTLNPFANSVIQLSPGTLTIGWHTEGPVDGGDLDFGASPVSLENRIVDGAKDGYVYAFDLSTGALVWKSTAGPLAGGSVIGSPSTDGTTVVVPYNAGPDPSIGGGIQAFDVNGNILWTFLTDADSQGLGVLSSPVISHGMVFAGYRERGCTTPPCDVIGALDLSTGKELWHYSVPDQVASATTVVQSGIYFGTIDDATIYRLAPTTSSSSVRARATRNVSERSHGKGEGCDSVLARALRICDRVR